MSFRQTYHLHCVNHKLSLLISISGIVMVPFLEEFYLHVFFDRDY